MDEFLEFLPQDEWKLVQGLRHLIIDLVPQVKEKLSFNVPFYSRNKGLFFVWPASVLWGKTKTYEGVRFGFQHGYLLRDESGYLEQGKRKHVYWKTLPQMDENDLDILKMLILESIEIDDAFRTKKAK